MKTKTGLIVSVAAAAIFASAAARSEAVRAVDCVRDANLDWWAAQDNAFCRAVMEEVFAAAGVQPEWQEFGADHMMVSTNAEVICSVFRNPDILESYDFPVQPLGRMHFALYTTPDRALAMKSTKITDWPRMRVGYSPVSQGQNQDRQRYFRHARLNPEFVEIPTSAGAVDALKAGDIDALFLYTPIGMRPEGLTEIVPIGERNVYFAVRKDRPELLKRLSGAYREFYVKEIDKIDALRERHLGVPRPTRRVRLAAYVRGEFFEVSPDGDHSGALDTWMKAICGRTHWTVDWVYGDFDQSLDDVRNGRLDLVAGIGYTPSRRGSFLFPHKPIGMLRVYLWSRPGGPYRPGEPETWRGMRVGLLSGTVSGERARRQFQAQDVGVTVREFHSDRDMIAAYFNGQIDACIDMEQPELANEQALHVYASHPMFVCASNSRPDIFEELEQALEEICDDFPRYLRMISEHHYGIRSEMAALSLGESEWLARRVEKDLPVYVDFSPWPFPLVDEDGNPDGFVGDFLAELSRKTGLRFLPQEQTGIQTAEAKFLRGDTMLWIPYPERPDETFGATSVASLPVPQTVATQLGATDMHREFEIFAAPGAPEQLVSIIRKVVAGIDPTQLQEMFMADYAERQVVHRVFGLTRRELLRRASWCGLAILLLVVIYGSIMMALLRRQARRANLAAAAAEEHARAKTRFLAMMSHELRTPLNAVIGFSEFLGRDGIDEKTRREYTDGILLSANALLELINDILDLSKLEAGSMNMRNGACNVNQLLRELPAIFGYRVRRHNVKLVVNAPETPVPTIGISQQGLRQILINLVGNSAKFTESGSITVSVGWAQASGTLHLVVSDTGCGISPEKMSKLFDPFVQDIKSRMINRAGEIKGSGLGLPIVKRMVENAGGTIRAESELGKGTSFFIDIPSLEVVREPSATGAQSDGADAGSGAGIVPERVLVVDDMSMNRKVLGIHLGNLGVKEVRYAENGRKALEVMDEWLPEVVLTDMWMPEMDGTQLAEAMHRERRFAEIPIVAVTADVDVGSSYDMSLFSKILAKPVTHAKLESLFHQL